MSWDAFVPLFCLLFGLELGEATPEIRPELIRALVLGNDGKHFFQATDFVHRGLGLAIPLFNLKILWGQVGRHGFLG